MDIICSKINSYTIYHTIFIFIFLLTAFCSTNSYSAAPDRNFSDQGSQEPRHSQEKLNAQELRDFKEFLREDRKMLRALHDGPNRGGLGLGTNTRARQDEVSMRGEANLGRPSRTNENLAEGPWLTTEAQQFVNIKKTAYLRGNNKTVNGIQMTSSFVAETATRVAVFFSAEACIAEVGFGLTGGGDASGNRSLPDCENAENTNRRMFVRALIDGQAVDPADVVFTVGNVQGVRSFIFTTTVAAGIHTVEMQWRVDPANRETNRRVIGYLRDASLLIRQGAVHSSGVGGLSVRTAPSGQTLNKADNIWMTIPDMMHAVRVPLGGVLTASFSAESYTSGDARMAVRALLDGAPMDPADMIFAKGSSPQSRAIHFIKQDINPGVHTVSFQWLADGVGEVHVADRSMVLAAATNITSTPTHPVIAINGVLDKVEQGLPQEPVPGLQLPIWIPPQGNGEVAVIVSGEVGSSNQADVELALEVDNVVVAHSTVTIAGDTNAVQNRSWIFDVKKLTPGLHGIRIVWAAKGAANSVAYMGDRTLSLVGEVAAMPDLAEAPNLGGGKNPYIQDGEPQTPDNIVGIEPVIGKRAVLVILWDADRPGQPDQNHPDYAPATIADSIFGASNSVRNYYEVTSGGRFTLENAGVMGWYDAKFDEASNYWNHPGVCQNGYNDGHKQRRSEAVLAAAEAGFAFSDYDTNNDGVVEPAELAIITLYPQNSNDGFGQARQSVNAPNASCQTVPLIADGVVVESVLECFGCTSDAYMITAHELAHQMLDLDDMYRPGQSVATRPAWKALMALPNPTGDVPSSSIVSPAYRLALGWVTPRIVEHSDSFESIDTKLGDTVYVLPHYNSTLRDEYFLLENRQQDMPGYYDEKLAGADTDDSGIGVWHVIEELDATSLLPIGVELQHWNNAGFFTMGRRGIRLLRPWTELTYKDFFIESGQLRRETSATYTLTDAFWSADDYTLVSAGCPFSNVPADTLLQGLNTLTWADCSASGYQVRFLSQPPVAPNSLDPDSTKMTFSVDVN